MFVNMFFVKDLLECCAPLLEAPLGEEEAAGLAEAMKALSDPTRLRLLSLLAAEPDKEGCICNLTAPVGLSQPTVSHHMKVLHEAGLVTREQRGRWAFYRVIPERITAIREALAVPAPVG
jgi:ArsR family transcriptional regulator